eukprot:2840865-Amphidinium_carterae.2
MIESLGGTRMHRHPLLRPLLGLMGSLRSGRLCCGRGAPARRQESQSNRLDVIFICFCSLSCCWIIGALVSRVHHSLCNETDLELICAGPFWSES